MRSLAGSLTALLLGAGCGPARPATTDGAAAALPSGAELLPAACVSLAPEACFDATDDNCNGVIDEGCGVETGPAQFVIAWDQPKADVDLLVADPSGELSEVGRPLGSGLTKQRDCPGRSDECHGKNFENVYLDAPEAPRGTYAVRIVLENLGGETPPIRVRFGVRLGPRSYGATVRLERQEAAYETRFSL